MKQRDPQRGFSLIEVMVAVVILGFAFSGLTHAVSTALRSNKDSELLACASLLAAGQIELLRSEPFFSNGTTEGGGEGYMSNYRWKQTVSAAALNGLHEVEVVVEHAKTGERLYELRTMLFQQPSESATSTDRGRKEKRRKR